MGQGAVPWWVRVVLLVAAAQALLLVAALVDPPQVKLLVPWPASPLNARFIAALYVSLGAGVALAATARRFIEVRLVLFGIGMATVVLLVLTIVRMLAHPGEIKQFPILWVLFYVLDPLLVAIVFWRHGWGDEVRRPIGPGVLLWWSQTAIFGLAGAVLLFAPGAARSLWPWAITEPQAQLYSAFFLTLAAAAILAARDARFAAVRWFVVMIVLLSILVVGVSVAHYARFSKPVATTIWFLLFGVEGVTFAAVFARGTFAGRHATA